MFKQSREQSRLLLLQILHKKYTNFAKGGAIRYKLSYNYSN